MPEPFGNGRWGRPPECRCEYNFTCGYCLRNAKPYHGFGAGPPQGIGTTTPRKEAE